MKKHLADVCCLLQCIPEQLKVNYPLCFFADIHKFSLQFFFQRSEAKGIPTSCLRAGRQRVNKQLSQVAEHLSCRERLGTFIELLRWFLPAGSSLCSPAQGGKRGWGCSEHGQPAAPGARGCCSETTGQSSFLHFFKRVFWKIRDVQMVFAASPGVFTWISHWNMDDASTIKCLSPEKGKGKTFVFNHLSEGN